MQNMFTPPINIYVYERHKYWSLQRCTGGRGGRSDCRETTIVLLHAILGKYGDMIPQSI